MCLDAFLHGAPRLDFVSLSSFLSLAFLITGASKSQPDQKRISTKGKK
jgi:hypothetical protein